MENITVCIRIRPQVKGVKEEDSVWKVEGNSILSSKSKETFTYDKIIEPDQTNESVFKSAVKETVENFLRGINVSIFAYGQTSTGKTFTMKGSNSNLNGMIPLSIKEIVSRLEEEERNVSGGFKYNLRASYLEIYNETVNDLLDSGKKNLEIRESLQKGVFINGITEIPITKSDKAIQLLKQGDGVRVIAETKLNEKSSRSHSIFRLCLEVTRLVDGKQKTFISQLNLIDLAGSENVSKTKTEGIRMKEGSNINKSLLALSNVIHKLSTNPKTFVNYRDSKLTRLLQPALSETINTLHFGSKAKNIKTTIKVNELMDEKNKIMMENTVLKNKIKQLEDMITEKKTNEDIEMKSTAIINTTNNTTNNNTNSNANAEKSQHDLISTLEKEVMLLKKILITNDEIGDADVNSVSNEILSTNSNHVYNNLCNQLLMSANKYNAPRISSSSMLMSSGKKMTDSARKIYRRDESVYGGNNSNNYTNLNNLNNSMSNSMNNSMSNSNNLNNLNNLNNYNFNEPEITAPVNSSSVFRRCMTDMKMNSFAPSVYGTAGGANMNNMNNMHTNNFMLNSQRKDLNNTNKFPNSNYINGSGYKSNLNQNNPNTFDADFDFLCPSNDNSLQLLKENDELRKNIYDLRKNFLETVQNKDNQIKSLNFYLSTTNDNCEKLIREAEENYMNLKLNHDRSKEDVMNKDTEIKNLNQTIRNLDANANSYKEEINRLTNEITKMTDSFKQDNIYRELEMKWTELNKSYEGVMKVYELDKSSLSNLKTLSERLKNENGNLKMQVDNCQSENMSFKAQYDVMKKNIDLLNIENSKLKNDIDSYKNEIATSKDKMNKMKSELNQLNKANEKNEKTGAKDKKPAGNLATVSAINNSSNAKANPKIEELENKIKAQDAYITQLESQIIDYKNNLLKIEQTQIAEYQKLLDEAFSKIGELQADLENYIQKNNYLEKVIKLSQNAGNTGNDKKYYSESQNTPMKERRHLSVTNTNRDNIISNSTNPYYISQFSFVEKDKSDKDLGNSINPISCLNLKEDDLDNNSLISSNGKDFIGKKRKHLTRIYQNIIDKNLTNKDSNLNRSPKNESNKKMKNITGSMKEEKENIKDIYFSTYEV